jgi:diguanylate cyclase (GGDEF)-like protein/PAS domain S-box-containing protein
MYNEFAMANPLQNEKDLYQQLKSEGITVSGNIWDFFFHRISEDVTAVVVICLAGQSFSDSLSVLEAKKILLCTSDITNIINTLTAASYEEMVFPQFKGRIPLHPLVRELFSHQIGNDIYAIDLIVGDHIDPKSPRPVPRDDIEKILEHCWSVREFLEKFKNAAYSSDSRAKTEKAGNIYHGLYNSFKDGLVRIDLDGKIQESNKAFQDIFKGSLIEMNAFVNNLVGSEKWLQMRDSALNDLTGRSGFSFDLDKEYVMSDGKVFPVNVKAGMIVDERGRQEGMWLAVSDISHQVQEQKELLREVWDTRTVIEKVSDGITLSDQSGRFEIFNSKMTELTGYTLKEANSAGDFSKLIYPGPEENKLALEGLGEVIARNGYHEAETTILAKDGSRRTLFVTTSLIIYKNREMFLSVYHDITARRAAEAALKEQEEFTRKLVQGSGFPVFVLDKNHKVIIWNKACEMITGLEASGIIGTDDHWKGFYASKRPCLADFVIDGDYNDLPKYYSVSGVSKFLPKGRHSESWVLTYDGKERYLIFDAAPVYDSKGQLAAVIETLYDDSEFRNGEREREILNKELVRANEKLKEMTLKDSHTGLYNFRYLEAAIEAEFDRARRQSQPLSVMMIDLDYFKAINDVYGHQFGDLVLRMTAIRLRRAVRRYDVVIRYGGEEFVIICPGSDHENTVNLASRIMDEFNEHSLGNEEYMVKLKLSIGVASYPEDSASKGMALVELADRVMSKVKETGGNRVLCGRDLMKEKGQMLYESNDVRSIKEKLERLNKRVNRNLLEELFAFARSSGIRELYTPAQMEFLVTCAVKIAQVLNLAPYEIEIISQAAAIHDIGKIGLKEELLLKRDKLSEEDLSLVRQHPQIGAEILRGVPSLQSVIPAVISHHERWDGSGYPNGLKEGEIPLGASIVGLADAYTALVSDRPYRKAYSKEEALRIIKDNSGSQFSPGVVDAFLKVS